MYDSFAGTVARMHAAYMYTYTDVKSLSISLPIKMEHTLVAVIGTVFKTTSPIIKKCFSEPAIHA